jgi:rubrerythrin
MVKEMDASTKLFLSHIHYTEMKAEQITKTEFKCLHCGCIWKARKDEQLTCPNCKQPKFIVYGKYKG